LRSNICRGFSFFCVDDACKDEDADVYKDDDDDVDKYTDDVDDDDDDDDDADVADRGGGTLSASQT
jgi:hypothetical protein